MRFAITIDFGVVVAVVSFLFVVIVLFSFTDLFSHPSILTSSSNFKHKIPKNQERKHEKEEKSEELKVKNVRI